jgi:hypothetical protein
MSNATITVPSNVSGFSVVYTSAHPWTVEFKKEKDGNWSGFALFVNSGGSIVTTAKFCKDNLPELWDFIFEEITRIEPDLSNPEALKYYMRGNQ